MLRLISAIFVWYFLTGISYAAYPYASVCPNGGTVFSDDYYNTSRGFWVDTWRFGQCECVSYVAWKLNQLTEYTHELFSNSYQDQSWGSAYNWKRLVDDEIYAHYSQNAEYLDPSASSYPYKTYGSGGVFNVDSGVVAWWDSSDSNSNGHVAYVEQINWNSDHTVDNIVISEYNFSVFHGPGTRTLYRGTNEYPDGFLYLNTDTFLECDLMGLCTGSGGGSGGGGSGSLPDFIINKIWLEDGQGNRRTTFYPGQVIKVKSQAKNVGSDSPSDIKMKFYLSNGYHVDNNPSSLGSETIQKSNMESGETKTEAKTFTAPTQAGFYNATTCIDTDNAVTEEHEGNNCSDEAVFKVDNFGWLLPVINLLLY